MRQILRNFCNFQNKKGVGINLKFFYEDKPGTYSAYKGSRLDFGPHLHGHVEIVGMLEGCTAGYVESRRYEIKPKDIFIVFPNQIHFYESRMDEQYIILLFPTDIADKFSYLFNQKVPGDALISGALEDPQIYDSMCAIINLYKPENTSWEQMQIKGHFLILLGRLFEKLRLVEADPRELQTVNLILNFCMQHFNERLLLEDVAQALHINKYYISHLFGEKLGMGFGDYVRSLRITQACRLLEKPEISITDVAYGVGFSSTRTFNRTFIKYVGMTPREYRKLQLGSIAEPAKPEAMQTQPE